MAELDRDKEGAANGVTLHRSLPVGAETESGDAPASMEKQSDHPCFECVQCCTYVAIEIDTPTTMKEYDYIVWYLYHQGVSIFVGVLLSLGSTTAVANVVAGIVITYTRAFRIGDYVQISDTEGKIIERTAFVTRIRTTKNVEVSMPNASIMSDKVINYSTQAKQSGITLHTGVTIGYDVPWPKVQELLLAAANATEHIEQDPAPFVLQTSLDDNYVAYELNAYTRRADIRPRIYSDLHANILDAFHMAGVEITSPHYRAIRDGNDPAIAPVTKTSG